MGAKTTRKWMLIGLGVLLVLGAICVYFAFFRKPKNQDATLRNVPSQDGKTMVPNTPQETPVSSSPAPIVPTGPRSVRFDLGEKGIKIPGHVGDTSDDQATVGVVEVSVP